MTAEPTELHPATVRRISLLDLTVDQVEALEIDLGLPVDKWNEYPSRAGLYRKVYAAATGDTPESVGSLPIRVLIDSVSLLNTDDEGAETGNP